MDMVRNGCDQSGHGTLKLALSQEWIDFLHAGANSRKLKVISMIFIGGPGQNGRGHLVHETLKSAELVYGLS